MFTGFAPADAIASLLIAAFIVPRAVLLLRDVVRVLSEAAPADTDVAEIRDHILGTPGVVAVHDKYEDARERSRGQSPFRAGSRPGL